MQNHELTFLASSEELARAAASAWLDEMAAANRTGKPHRVALSGGRITKKLFSNVVELTKESRTSLDAVHFFWADERCVPPNDPDSNFADAQKLLFEPLKISERQIHRIRGEDEPDVGAEKAAAEICGVAPLDPNGQPVLDLIFLGMGEDGHVASLFPGEPETMMTDTAIYRVVRNSPKPPPNRVTLGYAAIAAAKQVWVLVSGAGKGAAFREALSPNGRTPLARVLRLRGETRIFSDIRI